MIKKDIRNFRERFCAGRGIPPEAYAATVFKLSLPPLARVMRYLLLRGPGHFAADHRLIRGVGEIRRRSEFQEQIHDYLYDPYNGGFLRRVLRLRISVTRLKKLVWQTFEAEQIEGTGAADR